jgi:hypothetical protein
MHEISDLKLKEFQTKQMKELFEPARREIVTLMLRDCFKRFLESDEYKRRDEEERLSKATSKSSASSRDGRGVCQCCWFSSHRVRQIRYRSGTLVSLDEPLMELTGTRDFPLSGMSPNLSRTSK